MPSHFSSNERHRATGLALVIALAGGAGFNWIHAPLPWLMGPLLACALANLVSGRLHSPRTIRKGGQWVKVVNYWGLLALGGLSLAGAVLAGRIGSPNAWVIGPLLVSGTLTACGFYWSAVPPWMAVAGQVAIGMTLGTRFTPSFYRSALRVVGSSVVVTVVAMLGCSAFGWLLGRLSGVSPATMILATSPGGIAEMSLTARNLGLGVPMVTAFHVTRMAALVMLAGGIYRLSYGGNNSVEATGRRAEGAEAASAGTDGSEERKK